MKLYVMDKLWHSQATKAPISRHSNNNLLPNSGTINFKIICYRNMFIKISYCSSHLLSLWRILLWNKGRSWSFSFGLLVGMTEKKKTEKGHLALLCNKIMTDLCDLCTLYLLIDLKSKTHPHDYIQKSCPFVFITLFVKELPLAAWISRGISMRRDWTNLSCFLRNTRGWGDT